MRAHDPVDKTRAEKNTAVDDELYFLFNIVNSDRARSNKDSTSDSTGLIVATDSATTLIKL